MNRSRRSSGKLAPLFAAALGAATLVGGGLAVAGGDGFVDELRLYDKALWFKSDGWANGWQRNDTGWRANNAELHDGRLPTSSWSDS
jgi:hypothetical protein